MLLITYFTTDQVLLSTFVLSLPSIHYFTCRSYVCACFLPDFLIPYFYNPSVWYAWKFYPVLLISYVWMHVVASLSCSSYSMAVFMPITGFFKGMIWCKIITPPLLPRIHYFLNEFICFFGHSKIDWLKYNMYFFGEMINNYRSGST